MLGLKSQIMAPETSKMIIIGIIVTILGLSLVSFAICGLNEYLTSREKQYVDASLVIKDHKGAPASAQVVVFELADGGPRKLSEGTADSSGMFRTRLTLPRKLVWKEPVTSEKQDKVQEVYLAVNLWVIAYKVGEESGEEFVDLGTLTISVDPTFMKHPVDSAIHTIAMSKFRKISRTMEDQGLEATVSLLSVSPDKAVVSTCRSCQISACQVPTYPYQEESWAYTTVLKFATWDNIQAKYDYVTGSKIRVESKERVFLVTECKYYPWTSGSTMITLDYGFGLITPVTGRYIYSQKIKLKYYFIRYWPPQQSTLLVEKVYAVDTTRDGADISDINSDKVSWNGFLPNWNDYIVSPQNYYRLIEITGRASGFTFSVGVSVSYYVGVSVSLGVAKAPSPASYLYLYSGTGLQGYVVKTVSRDSTFLETYSNWVLP